jgi:hypothetical protein
MHHSPQRTKARSQRDHLRESEVVSPQPYHFEEVSVRVSENKLTEEFLGYNFLYAMTTL